MSGYVDRVLQPGEIVKHRGGVHWVVLIPGLALVILAAGGLVLGSMGSTEYKSMLAVLSVLVAIAGLLSLIRALVRRWTTEIAVTDRRIVVNHGFFRRHTMEMNMDKVESVYVRQSIPGRVFGYGTVLVTGTGGGLQPLVGIDNPIEFRNAVTAR